MIDYVLIQSLTKHTKYTITDPVLLKQQILTYLPKILHSQGIRKAIAQ